MSAYIAVHIDSACMSHYTTPLLITSNINWKPYYIKEPRRGVHGFYNVMDHKPFTVIEAIMLTIN